jgi:hypothetical protein
MSQEKRSKTLIDFLLVGAWEISMVIAKPNDTTPTQWSVPISLSDEWVNYETVNSGSDVTVRRFIPAGSTAPSAHFAN